MITLKITPKPRGKIALLLQVPPINTEHCFDRYDDLIIFINQTLFNEIFMKN